MKTPARFTRDEWQILMNAELCAALQLAKPGNLQVTGLRVTLKLSGKTGQRSPRLRIKRYK